MFTITNKHYLIIRSEISKYGQFKYMRNLSVNTATLRKSRRLLSNLKALLQHVLLGTVVKNVSNLMHCLHVLSPRHILSQRGDKSCGKVHSLLVLSLLRQQLLLLPRCVCQCVLACVWVRVCCVLLSPRQWVFNWNSVLLWVDHKATVACSSVKQCVKTSTGTDCAVWLCVRCTQDASWCNDWYDLMRLKVGVCRLLFIRMYYLQRLVTSVYNIVCA